MEQEKLSIFIIHPSDLLTDFQPHGDGLIAFEFINQLAKRGHVLHVAVASADLQNQVPENIRLYPTGVSETGRSIAGNLKYIVEARRIFRQLRLKQKIHIAHQLNPVSTGLSLACLGANIPVVVGPFVAYWAGNTSEKFSPSTFVKQSVKSFVVQQQQAAAAALLVTTPAANARLVATQSKQKAFTLPLGIDSVSFSPSDRNLKADVPSILFLGRLEKQKGIFVLLDAFEAIAASVPSCRLVIAGGGSELEAIHQRISVMPCQAEISLLGKVERHKVSQLLQECTVYCMPSYGEPYGMGAIEAMACGKPVVATNTGGLAHIVDERGGRKVPPGDVQALANALTEVLSSSDLQIKMGQHNRNLVEEVYCWNRVIDRLEAIYYKLLNSRDCAASIQSEAIEA